MAKDLLHYPDVYALLQQESRRRGPSIVRTRAADACRLQHERRFAYSQQQQAWRVHPMAAVAAIVRHIGGTS
jgi:hypothetical protein